MKAQSANPIKRGDFVADVEEIRRRARQHIENGAVTEGYRADRETVIRVLNEALATEIVCVLRYKRHYYMATGIHAQAVAQEFLEHSNEEQEHADRISERIVQLGGEPDYNPDSLTKRSHADYDASAEENIREWFEQQLIETVMGVQALRDARQCSHVRTDRNAQRRPHR